MGKAEGDAGVHLKTIANLEGPEEEMSKKLTVRVTWESHYLGNYAQREESC